MKYYLTVFINGTKQQTILMNSLPAFATGRITVGRAETNDIILSYPSVSRNHAVIEFIGGHAEIVDAGSLNKLRVNGTAYERIRLANGMKISIGTSNNIILLCFNMIDEVAQAVNVRPEIYTSNEVKQQEKKIKTKGSIGARIFAAMTDSIICMFMGIGAAILILLLFNSLGIKLIVLLTAIITLFIFWMYFAMGESGESRGTMGKIALGLWVLDLATDERISFDKATKRYFAKILSCLILFIGFIPMFGKKQTLHDYIAGTRVVKNPRLKSE